MVMITSNNFNSVACKSYKTKVQEQLNQQSTSSANNWEQRDQYKQITKQRIGNQFNEEHVQLVKKFESFVIEQGEMLTVNLFDYISGSLLNYDIEFYQNNVKIDNSDLKQSVRLTNPYQVLASIQLQNLTYSYLNDPLPRSTLFLKEYFTKSASMYMIDRQLKFKKFDVTEFALGNITQILEQQLDTSVLNQKCSDLTYINKTEWLMLFCVSLSDQYIDKTRLFYYTMVQFEGYQSKDDLVVRYASYVEFEEHPIFDYPMRYIYQTLETYAVENDIVRSQNTSLFLTMVQVFDGNSKKLRLCVSRLNLGFIHQMRHDNKTYEMLNMSAYPFRRKNILLFDDQFREEDIVDFEIISLDNLVIAIVFKNLGVLTCRIDQLIYQIQNEKPQFCFLNQTRNVQFIQFHNLISVYINPEEEETYFYCSISSPPGVVQIDMNSLQNIKVHKVYFANDQDSSLIAKPYLTTNFNYIIQIIQNIATEDQFLRIYCTQANYFNSVKFDIPLERWVNKPNFFVFPNYYLNILWYRDELYINSSAIFDRKLIFDASNNKTLSNSTYNKEYQIMLTASNPQGYFIQTLVNFTFITRDNLTILAVYKDSFEISQQIFYNCGDFEFQYTVTELFNGPNYKLMIVHNDTHDVEDDNCADYDCYFKFVNKNFSISFNASLDFTHCTFSFLFPYEYKSLIMNPDVQLTKTVIMLICLDYSNSTIISYMMELDKNFYNNVTLVKSSAIQIPNAEFTKYGFDVERRLIFIVTRLNSTANQWISEPFQFHFFSVTDEIIWSQFFQPKSDFDPLFHVLYNAFDSVSATGVIITVPFDSQQLLQEYRINWDDFSADIITYVDLQLDDQANNMITRVQIGEEGFFFCLQKNNEMRVYERVWIQSRYMNYYGIQAVQIKSFDTTQVIHSFDIFDQKYMLVYITREGKSIIQLFTIEQKIYIVYKMLFNLYEFNDFNFEIEFTKGRLWRSYYDTLLGITLFYKKSDFFQARSFVFDLEANQHDSFLIDMNASSIFQKEGVMYTFLTGSGSHNELTLLSTSQVQVYQVVFRNHIALNKDINKRKELLNNCTLAKIRPDHSGILDDTPLLLASLKIKPVTSFAGVTSDFDQQLIIDIYTQNQGIIITSVKQENNLKNYSLAKIENNPDDNIFDISLSLDASNSSKILLEQIIEGQNLEFQMQCSYNDINGNIQDCKKGIIDGTQTEPFKYYLEFVTQNRKVTKSFNLGRIFLFLDSQHNITFAQLPKIDIRFANDLGLALEKVKEHSQLELLSCNVDGFATYYQFHREQRKDPSNSFTMYFMIYQCSDVTENLLKVAIIKVFDETNASGEDFSFQALNSGIKVPNPVIDVAYVNLTFTQNNFGFFKANLAVTCNIEGSFSNLLKIFSISVDITNRKIISEEKVEFQTVEIDKDTFKVAQLQAIPNSNLMIVVDKDYGFFIYDMQDQQILKWFDVNSENLFERQNKIENGEFQVLQIAGEWPSSIHVITNYGIFIYSFTVDLSNRELILKDIDGYLTPLEVRLVRNKFSRLGQDLALNEYGYAFLVEEYTQFEQNSFEVFVESVSFFSSANSKLFKKIYVTSNSKCVSINQEPYLAANKEDQLAVSFVCDSQIFIIRICMRPHIQFYLDHYKGQATSRISNSLIENNQDQYENKIADYNQFTVYLTASNGYENIDINIYKSKMLVNYKTMDSHENDYILILSILVFSALLITAHYLVVRHDKKINRRKLKDTQVKSIKANYGKMNLENNTFYSNQKTNRASGKLLNHGLNLQKINKNLEKYHNFGSEMTPSTQHNLRIPGSNNSNSDFDSFQIAVERNGSVDAYLYKNGIQRSFDEDDLIKELEYDDSSNLRSTNFNNINIKLKPQIQNSRTRRTEYSPRVKPSHQYIPKTKLNLQE